MAFFKKRALFGGRIPPACEYCAHSRPSPEPDTFYCERRGVVPGHYHCRAYSYDPLRRVPKRQPRLPAFTPEDFKL